MRGFAVTLALIAVSVPAGAGLTSRHGRVAYLSGDQLVVLDLATGKRSIAITHAPGGPVRWSGDGKLLSDGGRIAGGPELPAAQLVWAPSGETAGYQTRQRAGAVVVWNRGGTRTVVRAAWGATSIAWGPNGALALGRSVCRVPCGMPVHQEVWIWRKGSLRRVAGPLPGVQTPLVAGWTADGRVLWWSDIQGSASIAADGLVLYANRTRVATTLVYPDYVVRCGRHLALVAGGDQYTTRGKRILLDGRDVSHDRSRSWVSPSCSADASTLVAAAGRSWEENRFGDEHRAIWQLLPTRRQLTHPPAGWTDESPRLVVDGSILFVRTRETALKRNRHWITTSRGALTLLKRGKLSRVADVSFSSSDLTGDFLNYYGHYNWPWRIAVTR